MQNLKIRALIETCKLVGVSTAIAFIVAGIIYTVPAHVILIGFVSGLIFYFLHMIYEFKLQGLEEKEKQEFDNNSTK